MVLHGRTYLTAHPVIRKHSFGTRRRTCAGVTQPESHEDQPIWRAASARVGNKVGYGLGIHVIGV